MDKDLVKNAVIEELQRYTKIKVTEEASFESLSLDSLAVVCASFEVEERVGFYIDDDIVAKLKTVAEFIKAVEKIVENGQ